MLSQIKSASFCCKTAYVTILHFATRKLNHEYNPFLKPMYNGHLSGTPCSAEVIQMHMLRDAFALDTSRPVIGETSTVDCVVCGQHDAIQTARTIYPLSYPQRFLPTTSSLVHWAGHPSVAVHSANPLLRIDSNHLLQRHQHHRQLMHKGYFGRRRRLHRHHSLHCPPDMGHNLHFHPLPAQQAAAQTDCPYSPD